MGTRACTRMHRRLRRRRRLTCVRLPAGWAARLDIADACELQRARGSDESADREGRAD